MFLPADHECKKEKKGKKNEACAKIHKYNLNCTYTSYILLSKQMQGRITKSSVGSFSSFGLMISWQGCSTEVWYKAVVIVHYFSNQTTDIVTPIIVNQGQHPCSTPNERRVTSSKVFVSYQREFNRMSPRTLIKHD